MSFHVVIPSKNRSNLETCVRAIFQHEPELPAERIIVIDDGIRAEGDDAPIEIDGRAVTTLRGEKPFVYARNVNLGIRHAKTDVILLNDDAFLLTDRGFSEMARLLDDKPEIGMLSPAIRGIVCNSLQKDNHKSEIRRVNNNMAFVCIMIPRRTYERIGYLDERFTGYGMEDTDYCRRLDISGAGWKAVTNFCVLDHAGKSSYRSAQSWNKLYSQSKEIYQRKLQLDQDGRRIVEIMFLAFNRLRFTKESFAALVENTNWDLVDRLWVYDDGSTDGTAEWLEEAVQSVPCYRTLVYTEGAGPAGTMRHFITHAISPFLAKIDCDAVLPPHWLDVSLRVFDEHPELSLLGIEPHQVPVEEDPNVPRSYRPVATIGGLGVYRASAFIDSQPEQEGLYYGFWNWQGRNKHLQRGFMNPGLPVFVLDRLPEQPWRGLSDSYVEKGWQRPWDNYIPQQEALWRWRLQPVS